MAVRARRHDRQRPRYRAHRRLHVDLTQVDFDLTSIAALLTILGYSLNDTVVIYDRIREMLRRYKKMPMPELLNESINSPRCRARSSPTSR
jgi:preprotein translocase subunit SecF